jgi:hypothetical protein
MSGYNQIIDLNLMDYEPTARPAELRLAHHGGMLLFCLYVSIPVIGRCNAGFTRVDPCRL